MPIDTFCRMQGDSALKEKGLATRSALEQVLVFGLDWPMPGVSLLTEFAGEVRAVVYHRRSKERS